MTTFTGIAAMVRAATLPDRILDGLVFKALDGDSGVWSNEFSDDVWHLQDAEDGCAWEGPKPFTGSLDAADSTRAAGMVLVSLREFQKSDAAGLDWKPCGCTISSDMRMFEGLGASLALAMLDASMQAHAWRAGER